MRLGKSIGVGAVSVAIVVAAACGSSNSGHRAVPLTGIHKIQHVIVIMQENRSFDQYFGTYPGADGIPMNHGVPTVCAPDPAHRDCIRPYLSHRNVDSGGPHGSVAAHADIDHGKMDGFILAVQGTGHGLCPDATSPTCVRLHAFTNGVMAYDSGTDLPNYWSYARDFVLQDHMFEPNAS
jgi:phospholipase C